MLSLSLSFGIYDLEIKKMVLVPFTLRMPFASLPSSFSSEVLQMSRYLSFFISSRRSRASPVSSSIATPEKTLDMPIHSVGGSCWLRLVLLLSYYC